MKIKSSVAVACFLPGWAKDLSAPLYTYSTATMVTRTRLSVTLYYIAYLVSEVERAYFAVRTGSKIEFHLILESAIQNGAYMIEFSFFLHFATVLFNQQQL